MRESLQGSNEKTTYTELKGSIMAEGVNIFKTEITIGCPMLLMQTTKAAILFTHKGQFVSLF